MKEKSYQIRGASLPVGLETILGEKLTEQYAPFNPTAKIANIVYQNENEMTKHLNSCIIRVLKKGDEIYSDFRFMPNKLGWGGTHTLNANIQEKQESVYWGFVHADIFEDSAVLKIPAYDGFSPNKRELDMQNVLLIKDLLDTAQLMD